MTAVTPPSLENPTGSTIGASPGRHPHPDACGDVPITDPVVRDRFTVLPFAAAIGIRVAAL